MLKQIIVFSFFTLLSTIPFCQSKKIKEIERITHEWAAANNEHNIERLALLYADNITFYTKAKDLTTCLQEKQKFFATNNDYSISIDNIDIDFYKSGIVKSSFYKQEKWNGKARSPQQAYLLLEKKGADYVIIGESDQRMDSKLGYVPQLGEKTVSENKTTIIGIVIGIMLTGGLFVIIKKRKTAKSVFNDPTQSFNKTVEVISTESDNAVTVDKEKIPEIESTFYSHPSPQEDNNPVINLTDYKKGEQFEKWVVSRFPEEYYQIKEWRGDKYHEGRYAISNKYPDLEIIYNHRNNYGVFAVECKWRAELAGNKIEWARFDQLKCYKEFEETSGKQVFIVIGIGGTPDNPNEIYIIPLNKVTSTELTSYQLKNYRKYSMGNFFYNNYHKSLT